MFNTSVTPGMLGIKGGRERQAPMETVEAKWMRKERMMLEVDVTPYCLEE